MKKLFFLFVFVISAVCLFAEDYVVTIFNETGYTIFYIFVSPEDSIKWEEDLLEDDVLYDTDSISITLTGYDTNVFDIMLEDEDGDTYTLRGVELDPNVENELYFNLEALDT